ncbi:MAG: outer membrane lipoprotein-sorting protein [Thermus sp.]|uniref:outer membrane lipoprotein-sorting protein n=1 Tax=unclassified Thermus TaxID=2619321 RepID=UPI00059D543B|nr:MULTISPECIES: outer membrane lipoprotein-sorting protein [unclassified Thermus]MCS7218990.1 outer membrane lipoprotein-sorting protein [Thermus sp.]MCX7850376.1 outer membrane lipoprotein-sorting protein [Thermus sp.]
MRRWAFLFLWLGLMALGQSPEEKLRAALDRLRGPAHQAVYTLLVERPGSMRTYRLQVYTDGERAHIRVLEPRSEAGQAFLSLGQDLYLYDPRLGRTLRLPPTGRSERFLGSDLTYQDLMGRDLEALFSVAEEKGVLVLTPRPGAATPYGRVEVYLKGGLVERVLYYDQRGQGVRELLLAGYQRFQEAYLPREMELRDLLRSGYRTRVEIGEVRVGPVPERCFNPLYLERGC